MYCQCIEERLKEELEEPIIPDEESSLSGSESNLESKLTSTTVDTPGKGNTQKMGTFNFFFCLFVLFYFV